MGQALVASPPVALNSFSQLTAKNWQGAPTKSAALKGVALAAGQELTVFQYGGGPGVVSSLYVSLPYLVGGSATSQNGYNGVLNVYVDGEATPSISFDVGAPFMWWSAGLQTVWTANIMSALWNVGTGSTTLNSTLLNFFFPIPWHASIRITFIATTSMPALTQQNFAVYYVTGVDFPYKLCSSCLTYDNSVGVLGNTQYNKDSISGSGAVKFLNVQGAAGHIVFQSLCVSSAVNASATFGETNIGLYLDGNPPASAPSNTCHSMTTIGGSPDVDSSGTEDWFRTAFFGLNGQTTASSPAYWSPSLTHPTSNTLIHYTVDHLEGDGGLRFQSSAVLQWETGRRPIDQNNTVSNTAFTPFWLVLYYKNYPMP